MLDIGILIIIIIIAIALGKKMTDFIVHDRSCSFLEETFINFGIGMGLFALIVLYLGLAGLLYKWVAITMLASLAVILRKDIVHVTSSCLVWSKGLMKARKSFFDRILLSFLSFTWFLTLIGSLSPILGMDALSYHMRDPKLFIEAHKIVHVPYTRDSVWPFLTQMLFTLGLMLKGAGLAKLFHFVFGVFSIMGVYCLCRRYWPRTNSLLAAVIFALIPAIFTGTTYAYTDMAVVFYTICAFYAFIVWLETQNNRWFYVAAIACGFLLGIKITSAVVPALIVCLYIFSIFRQRRLVKSTLPLLMFSAIILAIAAVWYIRSWLIFGNPIFPFASYLFGGHGYPEEYLRYDATSGIGVGLIQYITMLWHITLYPDTFGGESLGALFLIFLPFLVFERKPSLFIKYVIVVAGVLYTSWFFVYQYVRFLYPTLPFLSILVAYVYYAMRVKDKVLSKIATAVLMALFFYSAVLSVYHNADKFPVVLGLEKKRDFLLKRERTYAMAEYINQNLPKDSKVLVLNEVRLYYFDRSVAVATSVKADLLYDRNIKFKGSLDEYLKEVKFGYILYCRDDSADGARQKFLTPRDFSLGSYTMLKETKFAYKDEKFLYQLWKIDTKHIL